MASFDSSEDVTFIEPVRSAERLIGLGMFVPALGELRRFAELLGKELAKRRGFEIPAQLQDLERLLIEQGVLDEDHGKLFRRMRLDGNEAVHDGKGDEFLASRNLDRARELAAWFYQQCEEPEKSRQRAAAEATARREEEERLTEARRTEQQRAEAERQSHDAADQIRQQEVRREAAQPSERERVDEEHRTQAPAGPTFVGGNGPHERTRKKPWAKRVWKEWPYAPHALGVAIAAIGMGPAMVLAGNGFESLAVAAVFVTLGAVPVLRLVNLIWPSFLREFFEE